METFPQILQAILKEGILPGPQIGVVLKDVKFKTILDEMEPPTWNAFTSIRGNFLMDSMDGIQNLQKYYLVMLSHVTKN